MTTKLLLLATLAKMQDMSCPIRGRFLVIRSKPKGLLSSSHVLSHTGTFTVGCQERYCAKMDLPILGIPGSDLRRCTVLAAQGSHGQNLVVRIQNVGPASRNFPQGRGRVVTRAGGPCRRAWPEPAAGTPAPSCPWAASPSLYPPLRCWQPFSDD